MNSYTLFNWMLLKSSDYNTLVKERDEAKERGAVLHNHSLSLTEQLHSSQADLVKTTLAKADVETALRLSKEQCSGAQQENLRWADRWDEIHANLLILEVDIKRMTEQLTKSQADLKYTTDKLALKTAEAKQDHDDLLEARKLLWGIPDQLPREIAAEVDWERCGLPNPLEVQH
jgi:chromosome segregation ATPase